MTEPSSKLFVCPFPDCDYTGSEGWMHIKEKHKDRMDEAAALLDKEKNEEEQKAIDKQTKKLADGVKLLELMGRFASHYDDSVQEDIMVIRSATTRCAVIFASTMQDSRELSLALTSLESAYLWAKVGLERTCPAKVDKAEAVIP